MDKNKTFYIKYYATKHKKFITRKARWGDKSKIWKTKAGKPALTYFDLDQNNYRRAIGGYKIIQ